MTSPTDAPEDEQGTGPLGSIDAEIRQMLGLFDVPAFARRGQDLEHALARLDARCRHARADLLEMVHVRLRQWAAVATGPDDWADTLDRPVAPYWDLTGAEEPPRWADRPGSSRRRRAVARDLIASISRFNDRWTSFLDGLDLSRVNDRVRGYNEKYLIEKECVLGSDRVAARLFRPAQPIMGDDLRARFPTLPEPVLLS